MRDLINLQVFRVSVSLGVLVSLLFFMVISPSLKNAKSEEKIDTTLAVEIIDDKNIQEPESIKDTNQNVNKTRRKRNKLATLLSTLKVILEEELKCSRVQDNKDEVVDNKELAKCENEAEVVNGTIKESVCKNVQNKSFDCDKILERITAALEKSKAFSMRKEKEKPPINMVPIFKRAKNAEPLEDESNKKHKLVSNKKHKQANRLQDRPPIPIAKLAVNVDPNLQLSQSNIPTASQMFTTPQRFLDTLPCLRTSDILDDTYLIPNTCNTNLNYRPIINTEYRVPTQSPIPSITYKEADKTIAMLFKPKVISLMQVYGNLLKKLTVTVLVPYYVSKLGI